MIKRAVMVLGTAAFWSGQSLAQAPASDTELSKDVENPVTRQITLPLRYKADFNDGAYKATKDTFEIDQAVVPFRLNGDWALITRTKLPAEALPPKKLGEHWSFGFSNGYTTFFLDGTLDFIDRTAQEKKPFFAWFNSSRMHIWTRLKPESQGRPRTRTIGRTARVRKFGWYCGPILA